MHETHENFMGGFMFSEPNDIKIISLLDGPSLDELH